MQSAEQLVLDLSSPDLRENALLELSKKRELFQDLAPLLWNSFGTIAALLQVLYVCRRCLRICRGGGGGGGYSTVLPTAEVIPPHRPPPSKPESRSNPATVGALGTSKTRTRHLRARMRAGGLSHNTS
ncbi:putative transcription regulator Rcd1-like family [Helianthus annuus]|nr:putative transcription regulator Rcd1-like family [Helianthus annuus]